MRKITVHSLGCTKNVVVDKTLDSPEWGYALYPNFQKGLVELTIVFDLLVPNGNKQHLLCQSKSIYLIYGSSKDTFYKELEIIPELVQISMAHTRLFLMLNNPNLSHVQLQVFHSNFFIQEINLQLSEQGN